MTSHRSHTQKLSLVTSFLFLLSLAAISTITTTTKAFVFGSARNHRRILFGGLQQQPKRGWTKTFRQKQLHFRGGAASRVAMALFSSKPDHDSPTAFSAATMRLESPSAERNKDPIWGVISTKVIPNLPQEEQPQRPWSILETAAGAGVHTEHFAANLLEMTKSNNAAGKEPPFAWLATDPSQESLDSIKARISERDLGAVVTAPKKVTLGGATGIYEEGVSGEIGNPLDLVISINMIHISPWEATLGLMKIAGQRLREPSGEGNDGGYLYCYGPYKQEDKIVPSNENFDRSLKSRNPEWGVRNLTDVVRAAKTEGLELVEIVDMPANNTSLIFRRIHRKS